MCKRVVGVHNGHNSSAALVQDGLLSFALQEERLTRVKNQVRDLAQSFLVRSRHALARFKEFRHPFKLCDSQRALHFAQAVVIAQPRVIQPG